MTEREMWREQGYLVLRQAVDPGVVRRLYDYCEAALELWRRVSTEQGEPGGFAYGPSAWVLLHLNHPRYRALDPAGLTQLLETMAMPRVQDLLRAIMGEDAVLMQTNYYIDPPGQTRIGNWHRDCQFFHPNDPEAQKEAVLTEAEPPRALHMHIPLVATRATEVVSGSHRRWDTAEEYRIRHEDATTDAMPGRLVIELEPGDLAFFHVNSLHRGQYIHGTPRRTIAVSYGMASRPTLATAATMTKSRGYVASYQPWFQRPDYLAGLSPAARVFYERFIDVHAASWDPAFLSELTPERQAYFAE